MPRDTRMRLDGQDAASRNPVPLTDRLRTDPERLADPGIAAPCRARPNQCVIHDTIESNAFRVVQAKLSMIPKKRKGTFRGMTASRADRIRAVRKHYGLSQEAFARRLRTTRGAVGNWELGQGIKQENLEGITREFGVSLDWLSSGRGEMLEPEHRLVPVVGYVGAGAEAHFYAVSQGSLDEVAAPDNASRDTVAVEIRGESLGSLFDRWLVFYDDVRSPITPDLYNKLCVVGLPDDRVLIKKVRPLQNGFFRLISEREPPIDDVEIAWAARVKTMVPR